MLTLLSNKEYKELTSKYGVLATFVKTLETQVIPGWGGVTLMKSARKSYEADEHEEEPMKLGDQTIRLHAFLTMGVGRPERDTAIANRDPMFARNNRRPTFQYVEVIVTKLYYYIVRHNSRFEDALHVSTNHRQFIPEPLSRALNVLILEGKGPRIFQEYNNCMLLKEVELEIPFFEGVKRPHLECEYHGKFKAKNPWPQKLIQNAAWMDGNLIPL